MKAVAICVGLSALISASAGQAETLAATQQQPQPANGSTYNANEIVCQKQEVTGSRLAVRRVCLTRGQWANAQLSDKQDLERIQRTGDAQSK